MITQEQVKSIVEKYLEGTTSFLVEINVKSGNGIQVIIDDDKGISVDFCVNLSRNIEENLDREIEDYALEVTSAGIGNPFKVRRQYQKAIGKEIEIVLKDGQKHIGTLQTINTEGIILIMAKTKKTKKKRKNQEDAIESETDNPKFIPWESIKQTKEILKFK